MTFTESSEIIRIAKINQNLIASLWQSWNKSHFILKLPLQVPALFYSTVCIIFILFFYVASIIDIIPYLISKIANELNSKADNLSQTHFGSFSMIFFPLFIFFLALLIVVVVTLPKAVRLDSD